VTWLTRHADAQGLTAAIAEGASFGRGTVGLKSAAMRYYARTPEALSDAQLATILATNRQPSIGCRPNKLLRARDGLLRRLRAARAISAAQLRVALAEPLGVSACVDRHGTNMLPLTGTRVHLGSNQ